jgi:hypothetical protein
MDYASNFGPLVLTLQIALETVRSVGTHSCDGTISAALIRARESPSAHILQTCSSCAINIFGYGLVRDQFGLVLPSGPAAPLPPEVPPEPLLESPGLRVEPGLVFSSVPLAPPLPEPLPAAPPSKELSGEVFGCAPDGADKHPALPATEHPPASGSVAVGVIVESCAKAAAGAVMVATANSMCASFIISSLNSILC